MKTILLLALSAGLLLAESPARELARNKKNVSSWLYKSGMKDWTVTVEIASREQIATLLPSRLGAIGYSHWDLETRTGVIGVLRSADYTPSLKKAWGIKSVKKDQKNTALHEIFHCLWRYAEEESAVATMATLASPE